MRPSCGDFLDLLPPQVAMSIHSSVGFMGNADALESSEMAYNTIDLKMSSGGGELDQGEKEKEKGV